MNRIEKIKADIIDAEAFLSNPSISEDQIKEISMMRNQLLEELSLIDSDKDFDKRTLTKSDHTSNLNRGRKPIYPYKTKLEKVGDSIIVPKDQKKAARAAVANFKFHKKKENIDWSYRTQTLADGSLEITRTDSDGYLNNHLNKIKEKQPVAQKNIADLISDFMPKSVWYCLPNRELSYPIEVLCNSEEKPILAKNTETSEVFQLSDNYNFMVYKSGNIYEKQDRIEALFLSSKFLIHWLLEDINTERLLFSKTEFEPTQTTNLPRSPEAS